MTTTSVGFRPLADGRFVSLGQPDFDVSCFHRLVRFYHVNECGLRTVLDRCAGNQRDIVQRIDEQTSVDELVWKQLAIRVGKYCLYLMVPSIGINLVVDACQTHRWLNVSFVPGRKLLQAASGPFLRSSEFLEDCLRVPRKQP